MLLLLVASLVGLVIGADPLVNTPFGEVEGFQYTTPDGFKSDVFLGIRYGKAPDHVFRFEKPELVDKWTGFRHTAKKFRAACIPFARAALTNENYSEDCLFLNIVTPAKKPEKLMPVLVFIHGGGFEVGDSETYGYELAAKNFVSKDIIFVTIQYRLGPLGFFSSGDNVLPGNLGLWDQTTALYFLHEVLPSFGGDPEQITLSGHSAGSCSVSALLFSPHSDHLFDRAIEMSGSVFAEFAMSESVVDESRALADAVGCKETDSQKLKDCMKERTIDEILDGVETIGTTRRHVNILKFHPRHDKDFFPFAVEKMARKAPKKKTIQGLTDLESAMFTVEEYLEYLSGLYIPKNRWGNFSQHDIQDFLTTSVCSHEEYGRKMGPFLHLLTEFYVNKDAPEKPDSAFYMQRYTELLSDLMFNIPTYHEIEMKRLSGWDTWYYVVDYEHSSTQRQGHPVEGVYHASELRFLFNFMGLEKLPLSEEEKQHQKHMVESFTNFIKTGNPSTDSFTWPKVTKEDPAVNVRFRPKPEITKDFRPEAMKFWLETVPKAIGTEILKRGRLPAAQAHIKHTEL